MELLLGGLTKKETAVDSLRHGKLIQLNLRGSWSHLRDQGAITLAQFLYWNTTLKSLNLEKGNVTDLGASAFAIAIKYNRTLEELCLLCNRLTDEGRRSLIFALGHNVSICKLVTANRMIRYVNLVGPSNKRPSNDPEKMINYLVETRNAILIPAAVRRASLYLIWARLNVHSAGQLGIFPKELIRMISIELWATRKDPIWLKALTDQEKGVEKLTELFEDYDLVKYKKPKRNPF